MAPFYRRFSTLLSAGVSIDRALESQAETEDESLNQAVEEIHRAILAGSSLSDAMRRYPGVFSPLAVGLVSTGEQSGRLDYVCLRLAELSEQALRLKKMLVSALTYPAVLCAVVLAVAGLFAAVICSQDTSIFGADGRTLPAPTRILLTFTQALRNPLFWLVAGGGTALWINALRTAFRSSSGFRRRLHHWFLGIPMVGRLIYKMMGARFVFVIGLALDVGIPLVRALSLAQSVVSNEAIRYRLALATQEVTEGVGVGKAMAYQRVLPRMVTSMMEVGTETGELSDLMLRLAATLEEDVNDALVALASLIEPLLLLGAGVVAGFVAIAALAPMFQLLQNL